MADDPPRDEDDDDEGQERVLITHGRLKEVLWYDPSSGMWTWLVRLSDKIQIGDDAGYVHKTLGYRYIRIDGKMYRAARLAFLYMTGEWPEHHVDHINGKRHDDVWENLREATRSENQCNQARRVSNHSGFKGVDWHKKAKKYRARIVKAGTSVHLGLFDSPQDAHAAYLSAAARLHGEFANGG